MRMTKIRISWLPLGLIVVIATLMVAAPSSATDSTSVVEDPVGDASVTGQGTAVAAYQDIVEAAITLRDGRFFFVMDVAAPIPSRPTLPHGAKLLEWSFRLNTNLNTCPSGFPYPPAATLTSPEVAHCAEFMVFIVSDGTGFTGMLIDRTPVLTGGQPVVTPLSLSIVGTEITASVDSAVLGNPQSFRWISRTETWFSELGSMGYVIVDAAPDEGSFAQWPF